MASIRAFGFTNPILIDPEGALIAGHGRLLAAKAMGLAEVPTIELAGLTETQKRRCGSPTTRSRSVPGGTSRFCKVELAELFRSISTLICR